jgi:hypothetical protein
MIASAGLVIFAATGRGAARFWCGGGKRYQYSKSQVLSLLCSMGMLGWYYTTISM